MMQGKEVKRDFPMFGKEVEIILYDIDEIIAEPILEDLNREGLRLQRIFNLYDPKSELSELNRKRKAEVSPELAAVLEKALHYCHLSDGAYDISKGNEFLARKKGIDAPKVRCTFKDIKLRDYHVELLNKDVLIDLGSIAKGYIADKLIDFADGLGIRSIYVDARGDIRIRGSHSETVAVQHPRDPSRRINPIMLKDSAVATSGDYNQYYKSYSSSHIIGQKNLISVTVVCESLMDADAFATLFFVMGRKGSEKIIRENPGLKVFFIDTDMKEYPYNGFEKLRVK
jgi:thiamine biosynthesis lipoprotein